MKTNVLLVGGLLIIAGCAGTGPETEPESASGSASVSESTRADKPFYLTLDTPPAPILSPAQALAGFVLAPGYTISLVAAEPLVEDPVAADWDEDGRLYVAEMRAYMPDVAGTGETQPIGSVVRLSDTDNDGKMDRRQVLLDGLVLPRALRVVNEGLLVAEMGKLWLCPSATGWSADIDCGAKRYLGEYGVHQGSVEHAENGLLVGLDNWLYSAKSRRRLKLVDGELVEEPTLFRGQWGITQDDAGRLLYNTNSNLLQGDYYDAQALIGAGIRKVSGLGESISPNEEVFSVRVNPGVNRAYLPGVLRDDGRLRTATSASGMVVYRGGARGPDDPDVFVTEPAANLIAAFTLRESGLALSAERHLYPDAQWGQRDFLASADERFRPVDVLNGPDGSLYVIDFYRGVIQDHVFLSEQLRAQALERGLDRPLGMGRIWRIVRDGVPRPETLPPWRQLDTTALIDLLSARDIWRRSTAQRLLLRRETADVSRQLVGLVKQGGRGAAAQHAIWILKDRGELTRATVFGALSGGPRLAQAALLAGGHLLSAAELVALLDKPAAHARTRLYTLAAMRHHRDDADLRDRLIALLADPQTDPVERGFARGSVRGAELEVIVRLAQASDWQAEHETQIPLLQQLAQQYFQARGADADDLLDYIHADIEAGVPGSEWRPQALLQGLFEATREPGFSRVLLSGPHDLFDRTSHSLWPTIARARSGFTWAGDTLAEGAKALTADQRARMARGGAFYATSCANCHGADGRGVGALGPPLAGSRWVTEAPERLARIVLHGLSGPIEVQGKTWNSAMPGHQHFPGFDNEVASGLLTWLRRSWGHAGRAIEPAFISAVREQSGERTALWTAAQLQEIAINTHFEIYAGRYGHPARPMTFAYDGRDLRVNGGIFEGPLIEEREDHFVFEPRNLGFEFVFDDTGQVTGVRLGTGDGGMLLPRLPS